MNKCQKIVFGVSFALILVVICVCVVLYRMVFNGGLSTDSNDWIAFATLVGSIGTMLFTGLNVYVFYMLTSAIAQRDSTYKKREQQVKVINDFTKIINDIFLPNKDGYYSCDVNPNMLQAKDCFERFKRKNKVLLPTLNSDEYKNFVKDFENFCNDYRLSANDATIFQGREDEVAFQLYQRARDVSFKMLDDIAELSE